MKKFNKILIGIFTFAILFTLFNVNTVLAAQDPPIPVNQSGLYPYRIQAHTNTSYQFQNKTRLTINSNVKVEGYINCDEAPMIGDKHFEIEIEGEGDLQMNMTCTEEQAQLGLQLGNAYRVRNRNRNLLYQEGFCIRIQTNKTEQEQIQAKLKIQANNRNQDGTWAYYDEDDEEWVPVTTTVQGGYLVGETNHFSYWTILIPETDNTLWLYIGIGAAVIGIAVISVILVVYLKKRK